MMSRLGSLRAAVLAAAFAMVSLGAMTAAHADYYSHGHRYHHRHWVKDRGHPHGYYRYY